jgi:hypothetical protein
MYIMKPFGVRCWWEMTPIDAYVSSVNLRRGDIQGWERQAIFHKKKKKKKNKSNNGGSD